jgi:hypothetical protein
MLNVLPAQHEIVAIRHHVKATADNKYIVLILIYSNAYRYSVETNHAFACLLYEYVSGYSFTHWE